MGLGVDDTGALLLQVENRVVRYHGGEVSLRLHAAAIDGDCNKGWPGSRQ